jgi:hypothetical protein
MYVHKHFPFGSFSLAKVNCVVSFFIFKSSLFVFLRVPSKEDV